MNLRIEPYYWFVMPILAVVSFYIMELGNPIFIGMMFIGAGIVILVLSFRTSQVHGKPNLAYAAIASASFAAGIIGAALF